MGNPNNFIADTVAIFIVGKKLCPDKTTPSANSVNGAAPAPAKLNATKTGSGALIPKTLENKPININTQFV